MAYAAVELVCMTKLCMFEREGGMNFVCRSGDIAGKVRARSVGNEGEAKAEGRRHEIRYKLYRKGSFHRDSKIDLMDST